MLRARALPLHTLPSHTVTRAHTKKRSRLCRTRSTLDRRRRRYLRASNRAPQQTFAARAPAPAPGAQRTCASAHALLNFGKRTRRARARVQASEFGVGATGIRVAEGEGQEHRTKVTVKIKVKVRQARVCTRLTAMCLVQR